MSAATLAHPRGSSYQPSHPSHSGFACLAMTHWPCRVLEEIIAAIEVRTILRMSGQSNDNYLEAKNVDSSGEDDSDEEDTGGDIEVKLE